MCHIWRECVITASDYSGTQQVCNVSIRGWVKIDTQHCLIRNSYGINKAGGFELLWHELASVTNDCNRKNHELKKNYKPYYLIIIFSFKTRASIVLLMCLSDNNNQSSKSSIHLAYTFCKGQLSSVKSNHI